MSDAIYRRNSMKIVEYVQMSDATFEERSNLVFITKYSKHQKRLITYHLSEKSKLLLSERKKNW